MSGPMLVALVAVVVAVIFAGFSWRLARQVRRPDGDPRAAAGARRATGSGPHPDPDRAVWSRFGPQRGPRRVGDPGGPAGEGAGLLARRPAGAARGEPDAGEPRLPQGTASPAQA